MFLVELCVRTKREQFSVKARVRSPDWVINDKGRVGGKRGRNGDEMNGCLDVFIELFVAGWSGGCGKATDSLIVSYFFTE